MHLWLRRLAAVSAAALVSLTAACTVPSDEFRASGEVFDPYENINRGVHAFNRGVDRVIYRPASKGYVFILPDEIRTSIGYFADNMSKPTDVMDFLFQGKFKEAGITVGRFLMNTTIGFGGLADPATEFGIPDLDTDFGEVLYTWGFDEGAYIELPFFGPSTERDSVGLFVDIFTNPLGYLEYGSNFQNLRYGSYILDRLNDRGTYSDTIDSILYESADSYAQARIIFLQNRRFELAGDEGDPYVDAYADPYADPYEDAYANIFDDPQATADRY